MISKLSLLAVSLISAHAFQYPFQNYDLPVDTRVDDLMSRLTQEEKIYQTWSIAPAIERLGISAYNWRSNCLHGWAQSGGTWGDLNWTVFPEPIGLGATFDADLIRVVGIATADEGRALHNIGLAERDGDSWEAQGINCFAPNVNLFRDARWGRGQETFGEDPHLISRLGVEYTRGLQEGDDPRYIKVAACGKHYAVHSGPEATRTSFVANVTLHDLFDTYLPAMEAVIVEGKAATLMPAYSGVRVMDADVETNGAPDPANNFILNQVARQMYGFDGVHISDNGAVEFVYDPHHYVDSKELAAAVCLNATCDMDLGHDAIYPDFIGKAISQSLLAEETLDASVRRIMKLRIQLGEFDPKWRVPYQWIGSEVLNSEGHQQLNLQSALESIVLLRNHEILPLRKPLQVAVIGPNANDPEVLLGNYQGIPAEIITPLQGIQNKAGNVLFSAACKDIFCESSANFPSAVAAAKQADVAVVVVGISGKVEQEGLDRTHGWSCDGGPESGTLALPGCQEKLIQQIVGTNTPTVVVLINGGPISGKFLQDGSVDAIVEAFYPGALGGQAIADVLFGDYNPGGKMPYTVYAGEKDLPDYFSYVMSAAPGRTYRYHDDSGVQIPFGYGISYTVFDYANLKVDKQTVKACEGLTVKLNVTNSGQVDGDAVSQIYVSVPKQSFAVPKLALAGFSRTALIAGESAELTFKLSPRDLSTVDGKGERWVYEGRYEIYGGGFQPTSDSTPVTVTISNTASLSSC